MDAGKPQADLQASIEILRDSLTLYNQGRSAQYRVLAGELWKLLGDKTPLILRLFPAFKLHPLVGGTNTSGVGSHSPLDEISSILGPSHFIIPGHITFDGKGGSKIHDFFNETIDPIKIDLWLNQKLFRDMITIRQLIKSIRDKESAHADPEYHEDLDVTRAVKLPDGNSHEKAIVAIGQYVLKMIIQTQIEALEREVHSCETCKARYSKTMPYPPVYSFGNPAGKPVLLIGLNPSRKEFEEKKGKRFLSISKNPDDRRLSQRTYFKRETHRYFKKVVPFFDGPVKTKLGYKETPWDMVGVLDLVKCVTVAKKGQWNDLSEPQKDEIIENCEGYLIKQLKLYSPKVVIPYGVAICKWFRAHDPQNSLSKKDRIDGYTTFKAIIGGETFHGLYVPQRQDPHSRPEIEWVKKELARLL